MNGKNIADRFSDVIINSPSVFYGLHNRSKIIVHQDEVSRLTGNLTAAFAHCDTDVRILQSGRIVDAIACHRNDFSIFLKCLDNPHFVFRYYS